MKHAKPVLCAVRVGFMSLWMTFSFLKFRLLKRIKRIVNKQKNTMGLYWEVYIRKTKGIIKISVKKKKKKKKEGKYWSQRFEEDWIKSGEKSLPRNFYWPFLPNKEQSSNFYSNKGLDFQYLKENDQECTVKNPALKSLGRWNEKGTGGN